MTVEKFREYVNLESSRTFTLGNALVLSDAAESLTEGERKKLSKEVTDKLRDPMQAIHFTTGYRSFLDMAVLAVGPLSAAKKISHLGDFEPAAIKILCDRKPAWIDQWLEAQFRTDFTGISWDVFHELLRAGVCSRPTSDDFLRFLVTHLGWSYTKRGKEVPRRSELLQQDPDFISDVWRCFEVETSLFSTITDNPIYQNQDRYEDWAATLLRLSECGLMDRQRLLTATLRALGSDFSAQSLTGLVRFFDRANPTSDEISELQPKLGELLSSRATHVVKFALEQFAALQKNGEFDAAAYLAAAGQVFAVKPKGQPLQALSIAAKLAAKQPEFWPEVTNLAMEALAHDHSDVQAAAVELLESQKSRLHHDHGSELQNRLDGLSATLRPRVTALVNALGGAQPVTEDDSPVAASEWQERAAAIPGNWRSLAGVDDALGCLETDTLYQGIWFDVLHVPVLSGCEPIVAIATVDELLDAVAHLIEQIDSSSELERILDGVSRLCDQRPADFELRAQPLVKRLLSQCQSGTGIASFFVRPKLIHLLLRWLGSSAVTETHWHDDPRALSKFVDRRLREIEARVAAQRPRPLLCAPTHAHGWLDARVLVERLQSLGEAAPPADLIQALLRLAPDYRTAALASAVDLPGDWGAAVRFALGGPAPTTEIVSEDALSLWLAAGRARQARGPLHLLTTAAGPQRANLLAETKLSWKTVDEDTSRQWRAEVQTLIDLKIEPLIPRAEANILRPVLAIREDNLHRWQAMGHVWAETWMSTLWPVNPDHLLADSIFQSRFHLDLQAYSSYLPGLLQPDVPWNELTWLALWLALTSKDPGSRGIAIDVLIVGIEDGRALLNHQVLLTLVDRNWFKLNRLAEASAEIARVSPRHAWWFAELLQRLVAAMPAWSTDIHHLLSLLNELLAQLQLGVSEYCRAALQAHTAKGKSAKLQKEILKRQTTPSPVRQRAHQLALEATFARAQRWAEGSSTGK